MVGRHHPSLKSSAAAMTAMARQRSLMVPLVGVLVVIFFFITLRGLAGEGGLSGGFRHINGADIGPGWISRSEGPEIGRATNETLGFEKIIAVGLKERSDRRDALTLQGSLTGIRVEFTDGIRGEEMSPKAMPPGKDYDAMGKSNIGSWRGHMNAIRRYVPHHRILCVVTDILFSLAQSVLENGLSSALIMEDDVDWDIRIKQQMMDFARGTRALSDIPLTEPQHSPYGDDWDILWPGHCGETLHPRENTTYVISDDETVAPKAHQSWLKALKNYPEGTRIIHKAGAPICTFAYAVSYKGAQKIMAASAVNGRSMPYDNELAFFCKDEALGVKCVSVEPMLFMHHKAAGKVNKDSDIQYGDPNEEREKGVTDQIVISTRLNIEKLITGSTDWVMQW
ncbi:hypothetical protein B7463_g8131, partial [Scytalidium lignicola]